jgi:hypothetical protein
LFVFTQHSPSKYIKERTGLKPLKLSVEERKEVLSTRKLKKAQQERFKIVHEQRSIDGVKVVDMERDESIDDITCNLLPMVRDYLTLSDPNEKQKFENEFVYDVYIHDAETGVNAALDEDRVATVLLNHDAIFLNEDGPDSDYDSEDSNGVCN